MNPGVLVVLHSNPDMVFLIHGVSYMPRPCSLGPHARVTYGACGSTSRRSACLEWSLGLVRQIEWVFASSRSSALDLEMARDVSITAGVITSPADMIFLRLSLSSR